MEARLYDLIKQTDFDILFQKIGYKYFKEGDYNLNIIGVRNLLDAVKSEINPNKLLMVQRNKFDDALICTLKINGVWKRYVWEATTDPGVKLLKSPLNSAGCAILVPGQYSGVYKKDIHNGKYYAVCQRLGTVKVYRDNNKDNSLDMDPANIHEGMYGINIHRANAIGTTTVVDGYSGGCQVFANVNDFNTFMGLVDEAIKRYGNKFSYTLITTDDIKIPTK